MGQSYWNIFDLGSLFDFLSTIENFIQFGFNEVDTVMYSLILIYLRRKTHELYNNEWLDARLD